MSHTPQKAFHATDSRFYEQLGITPGVDLFEDGRRTDPAVSGTYEWWYFDAHLADGSKLVITFFTKDAAAPSRGLAPQIALDLDLPDGRTINKSIHFDPETFSASAGSCDVRIGENRFAGDLHTYTISVSLEEVTAEVTLTGQTEPWRPGTGYTYYGDDEKAYFAWLPSVPYGNVEVTYSVDGTSTTTTGHGYHDHNWGNAPMMSVLNNWYWGRGKAGPYTFITAYMVAEKKFGYTPLPVFMLAEDGKVIADDHTKVTFEKSGIHDDEQTGKPVADDHVYTYRDGTTEYTLAYHREETILRTMFIDSVHGFKKLLAKLAGFDGCYLRFSGTVTLTHRENGEIVDERTEPAIWELMYFGKDDHDQHSG
ncbi:hydroxyneurosporene dehydrogenase [Gordonia amarae]|uniref:Hydroxyneurosporene dehydrogenase n=2 Tax=Gordonia amarae TaxID=36821 RepID=G7GQ83_9ACTN|nr:lipocalin-like domain-containing protein [Gordonia amarae]MCS3876738.1 hypothetical protein [Gordonia amarae]QHN15591.1 hydroxyneurosporene dehydrogenase [Gordonia amarae]QHN20161.1 hydroxyneurosporene dehydrogenase [Gordonia amarae]QHN29011.1 hydroxyneurosporene dehydrogenase [Gordonia amarae]QHN37792.1 hydroxyneurosporene dehydrogenase [Gordonia amarae]